MGRLPSWADDWKTRLYERVEAKGYESVLAFAYSRPGVSVLDLAKELGPGDLNGKQVEQTMIAEAQHAGVMGRLVRETLRPLAGGRQVRTMKCWRPFFLKPKVRSHMPLP